MIHSFTFHFSLMPFHVWILISSIMPGFPFFAYSRNWRLWIFQRKEELSQWINHSKHFFWCDVWGHLTLFSSFHAITTWILLSIYRKSKFYCEQLKFPARWPLTHTPLFDRYEQFSWNRPVQHPTTKQQNNKTIMEEELAIHNVLVRFPTKLVQFFRYRCCELQLFPLTWI